MSTPELTRAHVHLLCHLVQQDHLDAALEAGLMEWPAHPGADGLDPARRALLDAACERLRTAWTARERFQARNTRLARRAHERRTRRAEFTPQPALPRAPSPPALPAAAAAILARARERAGVDPQ